LIIHFYLQNRVNGGLKYHNYNNQPDIRLDIMQFTT